MEPPSVCYYMVQHFHTMRTWAGSEENPITMGIVSQYQDHVGYNFERWERNCVFMMDGAFRQSYYDAVKFHANRIAKSRDKKKGRD